MAVRYTPPVVEPDSGDSGPIAFKLPRTKVPEPIMRGVRGWRTSDDYLVLRCHYTCDPDRITQDWKEEQVKGYRGGFEGSDWQREMEIDFGSYAGIPIYPRFNKSSIREVKYNPHIPLWRGWDFGYRNPAVVFLQLWGDDTLVYLHEIFPTRDKEKLPGIKTDDLARLTLEVTDRIFPQATDPAIGAGLIDFCDPAGNQKKETSDLSSVEILQTYGIDPISMSMGRLNRIARLRQYVEGFHDEEEKRPKFLINPHCELGIEAFSAAYRRPEEGKGTNNDDMPDLSKSVQEEPYIHIMDATEYVAAGALDLGVVYVPDQEKIQEQLITDLAQAYLGPSQLDSERIGLTREDSGTGLENLEKVLSDYIGEETLQDAFLES